MPLLGPGDEVTYAQCLDPACPDHRAGYEHAHAQPVAPTHQYAAERAPMDLGASGVMDHQDPPEWLTSNFPNVTGWEPRETPGAECWRGQDPDTPQTWRYVLRSGKLYASLPVTEEFINDAVNGEAEVLRKLATGLGLAVGGPDREQWRP